MKKLIIVIGTLAAIAAWFSVANADLSFNAIQFNGSSDCMTINSSSSYSQPTTGKLTLSVWVHPDVANMPNTNGNTGYAGFFQKNESGKSEWEFRYYNVANTETNMRANERDIYIFNPTGGFGASSIYQGSQYAYGQWINYVGEFDGTYEYFYINGVLVSTFDYVTYPVTPSTTPAVLRVGCDKNQAYFQGSVGPMKIWNRDLTANEVMQQYTSNAANLTGLVGSWTASSSNIFVDSVAGNNSVATSGAPTFIAGLTKTRSPLVQSGRLPVTLAVPSGSLLLNGTNQYAFVATTTIHNLGVATSSFMVCGTVFLGNQGSVETIFDQHDAAHNAANTAGATGWAFQYNSGNSHLELVWGDGTQTAATTLDTTGKTVFDGHTHDYCVVADRVVYGVTQLWIDGIKVANVGEISTSTLTNNGDFSIGTRGNNHSTQFVNGSVSNVWYYVWPAGTPNGYIAAIEDIHQLGKTTFTTGLVSKWLLNGTSTDSVATNTLTLVGSPVYAAPFVRTTISTARIVAAPRTGA